MYLGIDVHKRNSQVAVRNEDGEVIREVRVRNANLDEIAQQYAGSEAAIEATGNYYTIYDTLDEYLDVTVANPGKLKLIANSDRKTDRIDAKELARLVRLGSVPESYVPPDEIKECRALVRGRKGFVEDRTEYANKIHGLLDQQGITRKINLSASKDANFLRNSHWKPRGGRSLRRISRRSTHSPSKSPLSKKRSRIELRLFRRRNS